MNDSALVMGSGRILAFEDVAVIGNAVAVLARQVDPAPEAEPR
jgi:hypothetical protein